MHSLWPRTACEIQKTPANMYVELCSRVSLPDCVIKQYTTIIAVCIQKFFCPVRQKNAKIHEKVVAPAPFICYNNQNSGILYVFKEKEE